MSTFWVLLKRDIILSFRGSGAIATALGFYLIVITFLPLGLGPDANLLGRIAPGLIWIALLLSALLSLDRLFSEDHEDGSLELLAMGALPLELVVVAKSLAHWLAFGVPLALLAPLLAFTLNMDAQAYGILVITTLPGTLTISFIGSIGAALTVGARRGGLLLSVLILPFYIPVLIFGVGTVVTYMSGPASFVQPLLMLCALTLASLVLAPLAAAAALRMNLQ